MRWSVALEGYWLTKRRELSIHTVEDYSVTFRRFGEWIADGEVARVTPAVVNAFLEYLGEELELAPKTVKNAWVALSSFWTWAETEIGAVHVMRKVARPKATDRIAQPFSEDEVRALLAATETKQIWDNAHKKFHPGRRPTAERDQAMLMVFLDCGLRVSELCDLRVMDYDRKQGRLIVEHGKNDKQRAVFMGQRAQRALWRYLTRREDAKGTEPLFPSSRTRGKFFETVAVRLLIVRMGERAGVAGATPHRFRHTFAINFLRNGGNLFALQAMLGHSSLEMVRRYARIAEVDVAEAARRASPADRWGVG